VLAQCEVPAALTMSEFGGGAENIWSHGGLYPCVCHRNAIVALPVRNGTTDWPTAWSRSTDACMFHFSATLPLALLEARGRKQSERRRSSRAWDPTGLLSARIFRFPGSTLSTFRDAQSHCAEQLRGGRESHNCCSYLIAFFLRLGIRL
jgi:hypothetical protein